jgi:hypothetical protein
LRCAAAVSSLGELDRRDAHEPDGALPYMRPERQPPMPEEAAALLRLADLLCGAACEHCNQKEPAESWGQTPFERSPSWSYEALSKAANEYWNMRHANE